MRKIRIFFIASESEIVEDICDILELEDYQVFNAPDNTTMGIVYDVFKPDMMMTYNLTLEQQNEVITFFGKSLNHPLLLLVRKWLYQSNRTLYRDLPRRTDFIYTPFTAEEMLEQIEALTVDVKADIKWLSHITP